MQESARKAKQAAEENKRLQESKKDSKIVMGITAAGALFLLGYFTYNGRHSLKNFITGIFSRTDRITYPYSHSYNQRF